MGTIHLQPANYKTTTNSSLIKVLFVVISLFSINLLNAQNISHLIRIDKEAKRFSPSIINRKSINDIPASKSSSKLTFISNVSKGAPISLRLASTDGKLKIKMGTGEATDYDVSTDITKLTPITIRPEMDNPSVEIEGALLAIDCKNVKVSELNCSASTELQMLDFSENQLEELDLSACTNLIYVYLMNNSIQTLKLGEISTIIDLNISFNKLTEVDLSKLTNLKNFSCDKNKINQLDCSKNILMEKLFCKKNNIEQLNLSDLVELTELSCEGNKITQLDVSKNTKLTTLYAKDNLIKTINLSTNNALEELNISMNKLATLEIDNCPALIELYCFDNSLTNIDLSKNVNLTTISCGANKLTEIDLSGLSSLESLSLSYNNLQNITFTSCTTLQACALDHNKFVEIDFAPCTSLLMADVSLNMFNIDGAIKTVKTLPTQTESQNGFFIYHNSEEYPDDKELNKVNNELIRTAKARFWLMLNGETPIQENEDEEETGIITNAANDLNIYYAYKDNKIVIEGEYLYANIFSVNGVMINKIYNQPNFSTIGLSNGVYIINLFTKDGKTQTQKVMVAH